MLPRSNSVVRAGAVTGTIVFTVWLYLMFPPPLEPRDLKLYEFSSTISAAISPTRSFTTKNGTQIRHVHQQSNETLQKLAGNMTVLKANKTVLQKIIKDVNQSKINLSHDSSPNSSAISNPHPFKYLINQQNICKRKDIFLIVYVHTAPKHYKRRMVIRQTWGNPKHYNDNIRVVFVMGVTNDAASVQNSLYFESEQYGDIVQEDFIDTYRNLTYKGVAGLKWISNHCNHAKFVLKTDDDIFVNMFTLLRHLKSKMRTNTDKGLLMCLVWHRMKVMRSGKWKVDEKDFKDPMYPTYCSGSAFTMSTDVALQLHKASYFVPFFWVDDFYITGLLPMKSGVKHVQFMSTYVLDGRKLEEKFTGPQWYSYIFSHVHNLNKIQSVWNKLVDLNKGKSIPSFQFAIPTAAPKQKEKAKQNQPKKEGKPQDNKGEPKKAANKA